MSTNISQSWWLDRALHDSLYLQILQRQEMDSQHLPGDCPSTEIPVASKWVRLKSTKSY